MYLFLFFFVVLFIDIFLKDRLLYYVYQCLDSRWIHWQLILLLSQLFILLINKQIDLLKIIILLILLLILLNILLINWQIHLLQIIILISFVRYWLRSYFALNQFHQFRKFFTFLLLFSP
jgi:hypothetical protein